MKKAMLKEEFDNVAVLLENTKMKDIVKVYSKDGALVFEAKAKTDIPYGNKIAVKEILKSNKILKGGYEIGSAIRDIEIGELVHVHNVKSDKINFPSSIIDEILKQMNIEKIK